MEEIKLPIGPLCHLVTDIKGEWKQFHQQWRGQISTNVRVQTAYREVLDLEEKVKGWEKKMDEITREVETCLNDARFERKAE